MKKDIAPRKMYEARECSDRSGITLVAPIESSPCKDKTSQFPLSIIYKNLEDILC